MLDLNSKFLFSFINYNLIFMSLIINSRNQRILKFIVLIREKIRDDLVGSGHSLDLGGSAHSLDLVGSAHSLDLGDVSSSVLMSSRASSTASARLPASVSLQLLNDDTAKLM